MPFGSDAGIGPFSDCRPMMAAGPRFPEASMPTISAFRRRDRRAPMPRYALPIYGKGRELARGGAFGGGAIAYFRDGGDVSRFRCRRLAPAAGREFDDDVGASLDKTPCRPTFVSFTDAATPCASRRAALSGGAAAFDARRFLARRAMIRRCCMKSALRLFDGRISPAPVAARRAGACASPRAMPTPGAAFQLPPGFSAAGALCRGAISRLAGSSAGEGLASSMLTRAAFGGATPAGKPTTARRRERGRPPRPRQPPFTAPA